MPEVPFEEQNLSSLLEIAGHSFKARLLACSLWEFFDRKLVCRRPSVDIDHPNSFHIEIEKFLRSKNVGDLQLHLVIRRNRRQETGLVHELLHLNLIPLGFPTFRIWADDDETWNLAGGIINNAEHVPMLRTFISFGYPESEFLGPSGPYSVRELDTFDDIAGLSSRLIEPASYALAVGSYLAKRSIRHEIVWIAKTVAPR
ncbi:MAG TPA: hypothetical protein VLH83_03245 [Chthoniobacterales bacterium]|nr:hypothetical protein [Chthoniobacterales bacterium]